MKKAALVLMLTCLCTLALPAAAESFTINVCNSGLVGSCSASNMPVGTIDVTQSATNSLTFTFNMNAYPGSNLQWSLGSQGGGDTLAMQLSGFADMATTAWPDGFTLSGITATLFGGASINTGWVVDAGLDSKGNQIFQHEDGFGDWNLGVNNPALGTGKPADSLVYLQFTLTKAGLTLANLDFNSPDSNCTNAGPVDCYFAMHVNAINTATGTTNFNTGYAGATKDITPVPEPATLALFGSGLSLLAPVFRRFKK